MKNITLTIAILASFNFQYAHAQNDHEYINSNTSITIDNSNGNNGDNVKNGLYFGSYSGEYISSNRVGSINKYGLDFTTSFNNRMCITNEGKVGIGTQSPDALFTVKGPGKYIPPRAMNYSGPGSQQIAGGMQMQGSQFSLFNDGYVALFENTNGKSADGIAIKINSGKISHENNFITFIDSTGMVNGRIEGYSVRNLPVATLTINAGGTLQGGSFPSCSFNVKRSPGYWFDKDGKLQVDFGDYGVSCSPGTFPTLASGNLGATLEFPGPNDFCKEMEYGDLIYSVLRAYGMLVSPDEYNLCRKGGVTYGSKGADYAEWIHKQNPAEKYIGGMVVGLKDGNISVNTKDADQIMVISSTPVVLGNIPDEGKENEYEKVAFIGQAQVWVTGSVCAGDYILASGLNNGVAIAVNPLMLKLNDLKNVIGRSWEDSPNEIISQVNVAVGLKTNEWIEIFQNQQNEITEMKSQINEFASLKKDILQIKNDLNSLKGIGAVYEK